MTSATFPSGGDHDEIARSCIRPMDLQDALVLFELLLFGILAASWLLRNKSRAALSRRPETPPAPPPAVAESGRPDAAALVR